MTPTDIRNRLAAKFGDKIAELAPAKMDPFLVIQPADSQWTGEEAASIQLPRDSHRLCQFAGARRQIFHQHELVRIGEPEAVLEWREEWAQRGLELLRAFGLDAQLDVANDPFFGRRGRMLAANQQAERLKLELLVQIAGPEPTACASFNHHRDHFGSTWGIVLADGSVAHTACLGFGHERIVLALLRAHGTDPQAWPQSVRDQLWR